MIERTGFEVGFHNAKTLFNLPSSLGNGNDLLNRALLFKQVGGGAVKAVIQSVILGFLLIDSSLGLCGFLSIVRSMILRYLSTRRCITFILVGATVNHLFSTL